MQTKLLDLQLMSDEEINWLNEYHAEVWNKVRCMSSLVPQQILLFELYCENAVVTESLHCLWNATETQDSVFLWWFA
jgi:hypothetical protein